VIRVIGLPQDLDAPIAVDLPIRREIRIQQMTQDMRFVQWKQAQEATETLPLCGESLASCAEKAWLVQVIRDGAQRPL